MREVFEKLAKILHLEREKGFQNTAVIGGLEGFMSFWYRQARAKARTPAEIETVDSINQLMHGYADRDASTRQPVVDQVLASLEGSAPPPLPARKPVETPPERPGDGPATQRMVPDTSRAPLVSQPTHSVPLPPQPMGANLDDQPLPRSRAGEPAPGSEPPPTPSPGTPVGDLSEPQPGVAPHDVPDQDEDDLLLDETAPVTYGRREPGRAQGSDLPPEEALRQDRELDANITTLTGISDTYSRRLARLGISTVRQLLYHLPTRYEDFTTLRRISELMYGQEVTIAGVVEETRSRQSPRGSLLTTTVISDGSGTVQATWFNQPWLSSKLTAGKQIRLSGKVGAHLGRITFQSPRWEPISADQLHTAGLIPIYPLTESVSESWLRAKIRAALKQYARRVPDALPAALRHSLGLPDLGRAIENVHVPDKPADAEEGRRRLAFDELLLLQLGVLAQRRAWRTQSGRAMPASQPVLERFRARLPFTLTGAQERALEEILRDMAEPAPMSRLVQGDVGSGKTVVAAAVMLTAVGAGMQAALMAPTEILAEQHYKSLQALLNRAPAESAPGDDLATTPDNDLLLGSRDPTIGLLTGSTPASERREILARLASGELDIVVGTHALIQPDVQFKALGLAVVDEQHRFGVEQRAALRQKNVLVTPDVLVMSATPIPRSLALTLYGDLDLSIIDELPPGRTPVATRVITPRQRERAYSYIRAQVREGRQAFVICPLVEESEKTEARAAVDEYRRLQREVFPDLKLGLLHGRMTAEEKDAMMAEFYNGQRHILVSTSVVEVGIDVPNAAVMLVEGANRFGLAQLHQFRGRVGRGSHRSVCLLLAEDELSADGEQRLLALEETNDGFKLAETDLQLRGPGEFFGTRQSGVPELSIARLGDSRSLDLARRAAESLLAADPELDRPEHQLLKRRVAAFWARIRGDLS